MLALCAPNVNRAEADPNPEPGQPRVRDHRHNFRNNSEIFEPTLVPVINCHSWSSIRFRPRWTAPLRRDCQMLMS